MLPSKRIPYPHRRTFVDAKPHITIRATEAFSCALVLLVSRFRFVTKNRQFQLILYYFCSSAFGLGTMIYVGLEIGAFFEIPFTSPCHQILRGVNPLLQMIFTFMQMYFIFMNARVSSWSTIDFSWLLIYPSAVHIFS